MQQHISWRAINPASGCTAIPKAAARSLFITRKSATINGPAPGYVSLSVWQRSQVSAVINVWQCGFSNQSKRVVCSKCQDAKPGKPGFSGGDWWVENDAEASAGMESRTQQLNTGEGDVSVQGVPSQFVVVRGLEPGVTEQVLAKGVAKLYKVVDPGGADAPKKTIVSTTSSVNLGARDGSIHRVFVVRDKGTDDSWRFGFAEFHSVEDAQAAIAKFKSLDKFTIASKPVFISYIHAGVFVPAALDDDAKFSFSPLTNPGIQVSYWDINGYLRELVVSPREEDVKVVEHRAETGGFAALGGKDGQKAKKRKADPSLSGLTKKVSLHHPTDRSSANMSVRCSKSSSEVERPAGGTARGDQQQNRGIRQHGGAV
jgi:RNA recognition motif-containing protein